MVIRLMFASMLGGVLTAAVLWPLGGLTALLCAPFGASLVAAVAAALTAVRDPGADRSDLDWDEVAAERIAALRLAADQGRRYDEPPAAKPTSSAA